MASQVVAGAVQLAGNAGVAVVSAAAGMAVKEAVKEGVKLISHRDRVDSEQLQSPANKGQKKLHTYMGFCELLFAFGIVGAGGYEFVKMKKLDGRLDPVTLDEDTEGLGYFASYTPTRVQQWVQGKKIYFRR